NRRSGSAGFHATCPFFRYWTSTVAFRLSSPSMNHSNPRLINVGGSTMNSFAATLFSANANRDKPSRKTKVSWSIFFIAHLVRDVIKKQYYSSTKSGG